MKRILGFIALIAWWLLMGAVVVVYAYVAMLVMFRLFGPLPVAAVGLAPALAG